MQNFWTSILQIDEVLLLPCSNICLCHLVSCVCRRERGVSLETARHSTECLHLANFLSAPLSKASIDASERKACFVESRYVHHGGGLLFQKWPIGRPRSAWRNGCRTPDSTSWRPTAPPFTPSPLETSPFISTRSW